MNLLAELKRRNVIRMAGLYLVGAWLIVQVGETLLPLYDTPAWVMKTLIALLAMGFVPAVVFSWLYELTPDGLKRDSGMLADNPVALRTARRLDQLTLVGVVALLAVIAADRFWPRAGPGSTSVATTIDSATGASRASPLPVSDDETAPPPEKSIAVLPFVNMSADADNEYFSDGISEEILNALARSSDLHVAARTSSFAFKGKSLEVPEIARELHVRMVLEGSVRKQGDRVRVTAQLIDASSGFHVLSKTFDRELKDIFAIQDEIAEAISDELKVTLGSGPRTGDNSVGTTNIEAYDLYLRGLGQWQSRTAENLLAARDSFQRAIAADERFAQAWAGLALLYAVLPEYSNETSYAEAISLGREAAERALVLDPGLPETYAALGSFEKTELHGATGVALLERAIALRPSFATAHQWLGTALVPSGEIDRGLAAMRRASQLDPRSVIVASNTASMLLVDGRNDEAIAACTEALKYAPDSILCTPVLGMAYLVEGKTGLARDYYTRFVTAWSPAAIGEVGRYFDALSGKGDRHAYAVRLSKVTRDVWNDPHSGMPFTNLDIPPMLVLLGENDLVLRFIAGQEVGTLLTLSWSLLMPVMDPVRCDPQFQAVLTRAGLRDTRFDKICMGKS